MSRHKDSKKVQNRGNMESVNVETRKQGVKGPKNQKIRSQAM